VLVAAVVLHIHIANGCTKYALELRNLYSSPDIIRQIKSRRMRWAGHVARMGEGEKRVQGFGGKDGRKKTAWKTKA
jgi:hypothetical protein